MRLTVGQALVRFLAAQWSERDGREQRFFPGCFGIFGHGNVAGIGQALLEYGEEMPYYMARNEQAMVHTASGFARMNDRLSTLACTTSIGPGATNMVTGAALATINRLPVLLLPGDVFATRPANPVLQELEDGRSHDVSVNDCFKPVSKYWDRINRPEQLPSALMAAMRVLTDPAETGAVTLALPQDVQAEAYDWPEELFTRRVWRIPRALPEPAALDEACALLQAAERPLIVAGVAERHQIAFLASRDELAPQSVLVSIWFGQPAFAVLGWLLALGGIAIAVVPWLRRRGGRVRHPVDLLVVAWFVVPSAILMGSSPLVAGFTARYLAFTAPAVALRSQGPSSRYA